MLPRRGRQRAVLVSRVREDPVGFWESRMGVTTRRSSKYDLLHFISWLHKTQADYRDVDPRRLLIRQLEAEDEYEILTPLQDYLATRNNPFQIVDTSAALWTVPCLQGISPDSP